MKKNNNLRKLQLAQLDILKQTVKICEKYNLKYYLIGGTLIGAVRHKGFIPWDDDIDIAMPRDDYDKFIEIANKELKHPYKVVHYSTDENYRYYLLNIVNEEIKVTQQKVTPITSNVWIDILPIDGVPNNLIFRLIFKLRILYYRALIGFINIDTIRYKQRNIIEKTLIFFARVFPIGKFLDRKTIRLKNDKLLRKYKYDKCKFVGTFFGNYGFHEIVPKAYFGTGSTVKFEKLNFSAPEKVDLYLTHMYGDYMKLPPKDKQVGHHILKIQNYKGE